MTTIPPLPPRFLNWRLDNGRKVPCTRDGRMCDAHDQANHLTYEQAAAAGYGVAYALRAEDGFFFLDLDKCRGADGAWTAEATAIFTSFTGAWGEVSQSGKGLHIMGRCNPALLTDRRNKWDGWLELYTTGRFIAFGGQGWSGICGEPDNERDWTNELLRLAPEREHLGELPDGVDPAYTGPADDKLLIEMMLRSTGGAGAMFGMKATVRDLWTANTTVLAKFYPAYDGKGGFDHSSADAALMAQLAFWTGKDMPRMDRLFRRSALMREKYEREDYRRDTIQNSARLCKTVYDKPRKMPGVGGAPAVAAATDPRIYLTVPEMQAHFASCVYVRDQHRVLVPDGSMLKPEQFNATYGGQIFQMMPDGTKPTDDAFKALTQNKAVKFPKVRTTCFRPDLPTGTITGDVVNVYVPSALVPVEGDVTPFLDLLGKLLPDQNDRAILLAYMASLVQNPGVKFQWAPVLQGCEGNGKTTLFSCVINAVGEHNTFQPNAKQIGGNFNSWIENRLLILVEEIHMRGRREMLDDLKPMITNRQIRVESKGVDQRMAENLANWAFCTNYKDAVLKSRGDRRYAIFFTAQQGPEDLVRDGLTNRYFSELNGWLQADGYAYVAWFLKHYQVPSELDPAGLCNRAPRTSSTEAAIEASVGGIEAEIVEAANSEVVGFRGGWASIPAVRRLANQNGIRFLSDYKIKEILVGMGYENRGQAHRRLMAEGNTRPTLYAKPGVACGYEEAQGYPRSAI